jgi:hypothetical protein
VIVDKGVGHFGYPFSSISVMKHARRAINTSSI